MEKLETADRSYDNNGLPVGLLVLQMNGISLLLLPKLLMPKYVGNREGAPPPHNSQVGPFHVP